MKRLKLILSIILILTGVIAKGQIQDYVIEASDSLITRGVLQINADKFKATTQVSSDDTTLVSLDYLTGMLSDKVDSLAFHSGTGYIVYYKDGAALDSTLIDGRYAKITDLDTLSFLRTEVDGSVSNELQTISTTGAAGNITLSNGGGTLNLNVNDADASTTNELNSSMGWNNTTNQVSVTDAGGTKSVEITGFLESEVDGSITNEGVLGVGAGGANTAVITSNTSGAAGVTINGGANIAITETTSANGGTINIAATGLQPTLTTGNLTESVTGLQLSATRQVIGGAADLSLTSGYEIPTTTSISNWNTAYGWGNHAGLYSLLSHVHSEFYNSSSIPIDLNTFDEDNKLKFRSIIVTTSSNLFTALDNSNAVLSINRHPGNYNSQLGFSSNGQIYYRSQLGGSYNTWTKLLTEGNFIAGTHYQAPLTNPVTGTGSTNYLAKWTGLTTQGNSQIYDNGTNVGIGTTSPNSLLQVGTRIGLASDGTIMWGALSGTSSGALSWDTDRSIIIASANLDLASNGSSTSRLRVNTDGNVGIGITSPYSKLHVLTGGTSGLSSQVNRGITITNNIDARLTLENTGGTSNSRVFVIRNTTDKLVFSSLNDTGSGWITDGIMAMTSDGKVGIGTITPSTKLDVNGNARFRSIGTTATTTVLGVTSDGTLSTNVSITGGVTWMGSWNASTNTPTLSDATGNDGEWYKVSVAGTQNLGSGSITFAVGDDVIHNGTIWEKFSVQVAETDPIYINDPAYGITSGDVSNWNTAYGWGDHSTEGYLTAEVDGSITNEGSLTVGAGTSTTSVINSNTSGSTGVTLEASTGLSISESGNTITLTNSSPDQTVTLTQGGATTITGTYPNFNISSTDNNTTYSAGEGIGASGTTLSLALQELTTGTPSLNTHWFPWVNSANNLHYRVGLLDLQGIAGYNAGKLQGVTVSSTAPTTNYVLKYNGSQWIPAVDATGSSLTAGNAIIVAGDSINYKPTKVTLTETDLNMLNNAASIYTNFEYNNTLYRTTLAQVSDLGLYNARELRGYVIASATPSTGEVLTWTGSQWEPEPAETGGGGVTSFNSRTGAVLPASGDYTAAMVTNAAATNSANNFTADQSLTGFNPSIIFNESFSSATAGGIYFKDNTAATVYQMGFNNSLDQTFFWNYANNPFKWGINNTEVARLTTHPSFELKNTSTIPTVQSGFGAFYVYNNKPYFRYGTTSYDLSAGDDSMTYPSGTGIATVVSGTSWGTTLTAPSGAIVGTTDTQTLTNKTISGTSNTISNLAASTITSGTFAVNRGGTGRASNTAYALMAGGTTSTGALQQVAGVGNAGDILTSNGADALPSWQPAPTGGGMTNPMTTAGDIIYGGASGTPTRRAIGSEGQILSVSSGVPNWINNSSGGWVDNGTDVVLANTSDNVAIGASSAGTGIKLLVNGVAYVTTLHATNDITLNNLSGYLSNSSNPRISAVGNEHLIYQKSSAYRNYRYHLTPKVQYYMADSGIEYYNGQLLQDTLTANRIWNITEIPEGASGEIFVVQDGTGGRSLFIQFYPESSIGTELTKVIIGSNTAIKTTANKHTLIRYRRWGTKVTLEYLQEP